ncbi:MAG: OmpA family protein [Sulfuricurvum sp.]|uniref:OmpA family protein n=1 Tax=Sulfuricurvum sp. TaxID=2025608 RepID=UPI0026241EB8|nr:OmpA family protein [Sulfuricurvum sp.]MDD2829305.1 OmpA family protein [Sulfuricurvum sp.]MDD4948622.1 OmpA family protein [Sulfuricurvum sp.]
MKRIAYLSGVLALLVFSGCSTKEPTIDATANGSTLSSGTNSQTQTAANSTPASVSSTDKSAVIAPVTNANATDTNVNSNVNGNSGAMVDGAKGVASIYFDYDKFDIRNDMQEAMKTNAALTKNKTVKLEGNCDEFGSDEYNFALGLKRANSVKTALVNSGLSADSISMTSLGEGNPACSEKTQECWAKNRRVDLKLQ